MKKLSFILISVLILCTSFVLAESGEMLINTVVTTSNETTNGNIMKVGSNVLATGTANDLVMLVGETVESKAFGKYAFVLGNTVVISENIEKDAFVLGNSVTISGDVGRDLYVMGNSVAISGNISGNVYVCATEFEILGDVVVGGDVNATTVGSIEIAENVTVGGTVSCLDTAVVSIPENIKTRITPAEIDEEFNEPTIFEDISSMFFWICANVLFFSLALLLCPVMFEKINKVYENKKGKVYLTSLGWGAIMLFAVPFLAISLMITIVGAIPGLVSLIIYLILMMISTITVGYLLGNTMFSKTKANKWVRGLTGIAILEVVSIVPYIGGIVRFAKVLIGLGIVVELFKKQEITPKEDLV